MQSGTVVAGAEAAVEAELERARQEQLYTILYSTDTVQARRARPAEGGARNSPESEGPGQGPGERRGPVWW